MSDELNDYLDQLGDLEDSTGIVDILKEETLRLRDRLKNEANVTLTVGDTRAALDALEDYLKSERSSPTLTEHQRMLFNAWRRRLDRLEDDAK
jgi:hypothetical protein